MNISTRCVDLLAAQSVTAVHWSSIGPGEEEDSLIMQYAADNDYVLITFDLDFGTILNATASYGPSVVLIRPAFAHPEDFMPQLVLALQSAETALFAGALVIVELDRIRVRPLPL